MSARRKKRVRSPSTLVPRLEEAVCLLRNLPARVWVGWMLGAFPFTVLMIGFCAMLWESARAREQLGPSCFLLSLAFVWMKIRQARFAEGMAACLSPSSPLCREPLRALLKRVLLLEPIGLFVLVLSRAMGLPHPFVAPFYQSLSVAGPLENGEGSPVARARSLSTMDPKGASLYVLVAAPGLAALVFLNWLVVLAWLPRLAFSLTGIENAFIRSPWNYLHVSFWMTAVMFTWLVLDPFHKAFFLLRGYHAVAKETGQDLRDRVRFLSRSPVWGLLLLGWMFLSPSLPAQLDPDSLDQSVQEVSQERRFLWRVPPDLSPKEEEVPAWLQGVADMFDRIGDGFETFWDWLERLFPDRNPTFPESRGGFAGFVGAARILMIVLAAGLAVFLIVLIIRAVQNARSKPEDSGHLEEEEALDLEDEEILATDLPPDEWLAMVDELERKGEWRLALRALFLAFLARLGDQGAVVIARATSNREYERELARRAHAFPGVLEVFADLRGHLEQVWYGDRPVGPELLREQRTRVQVLEDPA